MIRQGEELKVLRGCDTYRFSVVLKANNVYEDTYATHCIVDATECSNVDEITWTDMLEAIWKEYNHSGYYSEMEAYIDLDFINTIIRLEFTYDPWNGITETKKKEFK
jgi:hypothetical protein